MTSADLSTSARLRALVDDPSKRSLTARLRDVVDDVEFAIGSGVSRADVLAELSACGFVMDMKTFQNALQKIRTQRKKAQTLSSSIPSTHTRSTPNPQSTDTETHPAISVTEKRPSRSDTEQHAGSHDPQSLNDIMRSTPDLEKYSRAARAKRKGELK